MLVGLVRALSHIIFDHTSFEAGGVRSLTEAEEPLALLGNEPLPANRRAGHLGGHGYRAAVPDLDFDVGYRGRCGLWRREVGCHRRSVRLIFDAVFDQPGRVVPVSVRVGVFVGWWQRPGRPATGDKEAPWLRLSKLWTAEGDCPRVRRDRHFNELSREMVVIAGS